MGSSTPEFVIAAPIWARKPGEAERLYASVAALSELGFPILLADGGSDAAFVESIETLPNVTVYSCAGAGLVRQVRCALSEALALGPRRILYTEPDKCEFIQSRLTGLLERAREESDYFGILLPCRSPASFQTFPAFQQVAESAFNGVCGDVIGQVGDYLYGPIVLNPDLVRYLSGMEAELGWGWRTLLLVVAHRLDMRVRLYEDELPCPLEHRDEGSVKDRAYRLAQMEQNVAGLRQGMLLPLEE